MKACVLYFSQTGNTKRFAEEIANRLNISAVFDMTNTEPSAVNDYDVLIIGTPVHGFNPPVEALTFVESLPSGDGKRTALFCTHRLWKGKTFSKMEKALKKKGYNNVCCVSVKGKEFGKDDFIEPAEKIAKKVQE